jgi:hypothetical protein
MLYRKYNILKALKIIDLENIGKFKVQSQSRRQKLDPPKRNIQIHHLNLQLSVVLKRCLKMGITTYKEGSRSV